MRPTQLIPGTVIVCEVDLESIKTHEKVCGEPVRGRKEPASLSAIGSPRWRAGHLRRDFNELNGSTEREKSGRVLTGEPTLVLPGHRGDPRTGRL